MMKRDIRYTQEMEQLVHLKWQISSPFQKIYILKFRINEPVKKLSSSAVQRKNDEK